MKQTKKVAVFCSDTLRAMGIQNILSSYFSPIEIANFEEFPLNFKDLTSFDYFIVENKVFCESLDFFIPRRQSTLILTAFPLSPHSLTIRKPGYPFSQKC
jgi:hypothetical protein